MCPRQLGRKSLTNGADLVFALITVLAVNQFHQPVPHVLLAIGLLAVRWYRPRNGETERSSQ
jgi:hypothetical protein